jgi:hypothetical protein
VLGAVHLTPAAIGNALTFRGACIRLAANAVSDILDQLVDDGLHRDVGIGSIGRSSFD